MLYYSRASRRRFKPFSFGKFKTQFFRSGGVLRLAFFALLACFILAIGVFTWFSRDLPTPGRLANSDLKDSTKILDSKGNILFAFYNKEEGRDYNRIYVTLDKMPKTLREATIAAEDKDFYQNEGFSLLGYARVIKDFILYRRVTGGSTITQQLVKNVLLEDASRTPTRKIKEFILAIQVDRRYSKDQILEMYLNNVPYGGTAVGVEAGSSLYFGKSVDEINLIEAAFLAGLPQAPSYYSPFIGENKAYVDRTHYVLNRMEQDGYISKKQMEDAKKQVPNLKFNSTPQAIRAPHFVMYVREQLKKMFDEDVVERGNLTVTTTLNYDIQKESEKIVKDEIDKLRGLNVGNGAVVVMDPKTGAIVAMVGSKDYFDIDNDGNFNAAISPNRQPGSALKPVMYATALEKGYTPSTLIMDVKTEFYTGDPVDKPYNPVNYDGKFKGPVQLRFALGNSLNIPAVKMLSRVGLKPVMQKAYDMGIGNWKPTNESMRNVGLSLVLGGREASLLEITTAYSTIANKGVRKEPFSITKVEDSKGKSLYKHEERTGTKVLSEEVAFIISHILLDNIARQPIFGPNSLLVIPGKTVSAKTGTTDSKRDNWCVGYTPSYVVGAWVGNNDNTPMNEKIASGVTGATPIWNKIMREVLKNKSDEQPEKPDNVIAVEIDAFAGGLPKDGSPKRTEYFIKGTEPTTQSPVYKKFRMSKHDTNNKLANDQEIEKGDYDVKEFLVFSEDDPVSKDGKNRFQQGIDDFVKETYKDDAKYKVPTEKANYTYSPDPTSTPTSVPVVDTPTPTYTPTPTP